MGQSSLVCLSASGHCAYRQDLFIAVPLPRGSCGIDKVPACLCDHPAEPGICQLNIIHMKDKIGFWFALMISVIICSCTGEQTDQQKQEDNLMGIWLCTESPNGYKDCYYTFLNDGKMIRDYDPSTSATAIYTFNADAKTLTSTLADSQETYQDVLLTSSNMQLVGGGFDAASWKFQKVKSVSFPELKVEEKEIIVKVGETKKLNISGMGIRLNSIGYQAKDRFIADTRNDYVVKEDNETASITGQYVGKCKLSISSKNGSIDIPVTVEPNYPLWEHRYFIDTMQYITLESISEKIGLEYTTKINGTHYLFDNISDDIISLTCKVNNGTIYINLALPKGKIDFIDKSLKEYGDSHNMTERYSMVGFFHNNSVVNLSTNKVLAYSTFLEEYEIVQFNCDDVIILQISKSGR